MYALIKAIKCGRDKKIKLRHARHSVDEICDTADRCCCPVTLATCLNDFVHNGHTQFWGAMDLRGLRWAKNEWNKFEGQLLNCCLRYRHKMRAVKMAFVRAFLREGDKRQIVHGGGSCPQAHSG